MALMKVAVLGAGRLGTVLAKRLHEVGYPLQVADPHEGKRQALERLDGVTVFAESSKAVQGAECAIIAVKPQYVGHLAQEISENLSEQAMVISMAAGITLEKLRTWFPNHKVFRAMPNLASSIGAGTTALVGDAPERIVTMLAAFGHVVPLDESQIHAFTGVVGSGPAFICRIIDNTVQQLQTHWADIAPEAMQQWLLHMITGTAEILSQKNLSPKALEASVAAPNGTTLAGLEAGQGDVFDLAKAIIAAAARSEEITLETQASGGP